MNKLLACAAALAACPVTPVLAAPDGRRQAVVSTIGLDLSSASGVARLDRRIRTAIEAVCGTRADYDPAGANAIRRCRVQARELIAPRRARLVASASATASLAAR